MLINGYPVVAEFVGEKPLDLTNAKSEDWKTNNARESQYLLHVVRCTDKVCCSSFQSSCLKIINDRFLSHPLPVVHSLTNDIEWATIKESYVPYFL